MADRRRPGYRGWLTLCLTLLACQGGDASLPVPDAVAAYYESTQELRVAMNGNVAELTVRQPEDQLRRGGALWARVGPYIYLFSEATQSVFSDHPGLAGVRVVTEDTGGEEVARALLLRDELNSTLWRRALNAAGRARVEGTTRVSLIEELVRFGEEHTTFEYSPAYVP